MLTAQQILHYLSDIESDRIERTISVSNTDKFCEAICAFSNDMRNSGSAAYLFIGAKDDGTLSGLQATDELLRTLAGIRSEGNILPQPALSVYKQSFTDGDIIVLEVQPSNFPPVRYKGKIWIRVGPRKAIANETEERLLIERRTANAATFDARPCYGSTIDELKTDIFNAYYLPRAVDKEILRSDNRELKFKLASLRFYDLKADCATNAGILFFGINPEYYHFGGYVQYVRFEGKSVSSKIVNEHKFTGDLVTVLSKLDSFIETTIEQKHPVFVSALREEIKRSYPHLAIRELLMNAVMHRDYESNAPIKFYEFSDRLEVINPGGLYGNARPENFPDVNDYRNPILAEAMKVLGYVNRYNRGIFNVQEELIENGNGKAIFDFDKITVFGAKVNNAVELLLKELNVERKDENVTDTDSDVTEKSSDVTDTDSNVTDDSSDVTDNRLNVTDTDSNVTDDVTDRRQLIIFEIAANNKITTVALATRLKVTKRTVLREIEQLKKDGILRRDGNEKTGNWVLL